MTFLAATKPSNTLNLEVDEMKHLIRTRFTLELAALFVLNAAPFALIADVPPVALKEAGGDKTFTLADARGKYVALHFLLKTECPLCIEYTRAYAEKAASMPDVVHVFIKPDEDEEIVKWAAPLSSSAKRPVIYRDANAALADAFGIPRGYEFHGETIHFPALILIDPAGKEIFRYFGKSTMDRFTVEKFVIKLAELRQAGAVRHYNLDKSGVALAGYDPVSYFSGTPQKGDKNLAARVAGATYYFANAKNRDAFLAAPEKYLPAYGGWCATAMAEGRKVEVDPENYKVTDGRLFLFYKSIFSNALTDWNKDEPGNIVSADKHWLSITNGKAGVS